MVVRGGGSKADLATFDAEPVARAIATSDVPVWTGIGHTGDQSVADEVANRSFITPTECGQELARLATDFWRPGWRPALVVGRLAREQMAGADALLDRHRHGMVTGARSQLDRHGDRLVHRARRPAGVGAGPARHPRAPLVASGRGAGQDRPLRAVDRRQERLADADPAAGLPARTAVCRPRTSAVGQWRRLLGAYDYQRQLERGYSVTRDATGTVVRSAVRASSPGAVLRTQGRRRRGGVDGGRTGGSRGRPRTGRAPISDHDRTTRRRDAVMATTRGSEQKHRQRDARRRTWPS